MTCELSPANGLNSLVRCLTHFLLIPRLTYHAVYKTNGKSHTLRKYWDELLAELNDLDDDQRAEYQKTKVVELQKFQKVWLKLPGLCRC